MASIDHQLVALPGAIEFAGSLFKFTEIERSDGPLIWMTAVDRDPMRRYRSFAPHRQ